MDAVAEIIIERLDRIERRLEAMKVPEVAGLTVAAFASRTGLSRNTIFRRIAAGEIAKKSGRIPHSELRKFLS